MRYQQLALLALLAGAGFSATAGAFPVTPSRTSSAPSPFGYSSGPGWTNAQVKRMARKARNVQRNRRAHRG